MMEQFSITAKGQVTIPRQIRRQLDIRAGTRVSFQLVGDHVEMRTVSTPVDVPSSGFGLLKSNKAPVPADLDVAALVDEP